MNLSRNQQPRGRLGYSLVELLLTTSLLLLFAGLAVVSMQTLNQGSAFGEGTIRFETMVRFAHAEAARSGRRVRIDFIQETNPVINLSTNQLSLVRLSWEPNPVAEPDIFQDLLAPSWGVEQVNDALRVAEVRLVDGAEDLAANSNEPPTAPDSEPDSEPQPSLPDAGAEPPLDAAATSPSAITFNPDGSCDAAEITLVGLHPEEDRRVILRINGLTGFISRKSIPASGDASSSPAGDTERPASGPENRPSG
jgi:hypothetical protein